MTKTRNDLANRALQRLQVVGSGQSAEADDLDIALNQIDPLFEGLVARNIIPPLDADEIEDSHFLALADRLAAEIAPDFGIQNADVAATEATLKRLFSPMPNYPTLQANYF